MITHCPGCHTHFRVHAEQLAARAGQVRCGKCARVFDALEYLIEETVPARAHAPSAEAETARLDEVEAAVAQVSAILEAQAVDGKAAAAAETDLLAEPPELDAETPESGAEMPQTAGLPPAMSEPSDLAAGAATGTSTFDFGPPVKAELAKSGRRWPWLLGALLLLIVLLAQASYQYRSAIIQLFPEAKPYAAALCASLGCDLPLPRRIELMSIEASDLQADTANPNVMVLSATLKNRAIFSQQLPLLELTLTDAQDQPVVRRVLAPQEYLGKAVNSQGGFGANAEIAIKVFIEGSQVKATGYRLYLFYP